RRWWLVEIVAEAGVGALLLGWPGISQVALLYAVGLTAVLLGGVEAASLAGEAHTTRERWLGGAAAVTAFIFGIAILGAAGRGAATVVPLVGVYFVALGVLRLVQAAPRLHRRDAPQIASSPDLT